MIDHTDDGLRAAIKGLDEVDAPAIDGSNPLAVEQLRLISRFLGFFRSRIPYEHARAHHEVRHDLALARQLLELAPNDAPVCSRNLLTAAIQAAAPLVSDPLSRAQQLQDAIRFLSAAISTLVRDVADSPPPSATPWSAPSSEPRQASSMHSAPGFRPWVSSPMRSWSPRSKQRSVLPAEFLSAMLSRSA